MHWSAQIDIISSAGSGHGEIHFKFSGQNMQSPAFPVSCLGGSDARGVKKKKKIQIQIREARKPTLFLLSAHYPVISDAGRLMDELFLW